MRQYINNIGFKSAARVRAKAETIINQPFHVHDEEIEIICVIKGNVVIMDSAAVHHLKEGCVHVFNRTEAHKITAEQMDSAGDADDNIVLTIHIDHTHYTRWFDRLGRLFFVCDTADENEIFSSEMKSVRFYLAKIAWEYFTECRAFALETATKQLIELLIDEFQNYIYGMDGKRIANIVRLQATNQELTAWGHPKNYDRTYRIVDYIEAHFREKLQLKDIARSENVSEAHLSRNFKENLGMSFSQFLSLTRCTHAARLISSTDQTVDQIAESSGFSARKDLAKQFRKWYQMTPSEYRREIIRDMNGPAAISRPVEFQRIKGQMHLYLDEY